MKHSCFFFFSTWIQIHVTKIHYPSDTSNSRRSELTARHRNQLTDAGHAVVGKELSQNCGSQGIGKNTIPKDRTEVITHASGLPQLNDLNFLFRIFFKRYLCRGWKIERQVIQKKEWKQICMYSTETKVDNCSYMTKNLNIWPEWADSYNAHWNITIRTMTKYDFILISTHKCLWI